MKIFLISLFLSLMYLESYEMINVFINTKWYMTIFLFFFLIADESIIKSNTISLLCVSSSFSKREQSSSNSDFEIYAIAFFSSH